MLTTALPRKTNSRVVFESFEDSLNELIAIYSDENPQCRIHGGEDLGADLTTIVGLSSPELSASIAIVMTSESVRALASFPIECPQDWLGELGNQLAGRLKNKMSRFGLLPTLSTPVTVQGRSLHLSNSKDESFALLTHFPGGMAIVQLSLAIAPDTELFFQEVEETSEEGSLELF